MNKSLSRKIPYCTECYILMKEIKRVGVNHLICKCDNCGKIIKIEV